MGRNLPAGALASILAVGLLVAPAVPAAAETGTASREIAVFPESEATAPAHEAVIFAGVSGFLHRHNTSSEYLWTRYDTGKTVPVPDLAGVAATALKPAGGDFVFIRSQVPAKPALGKVSVLDLSDQSWQQWAPPAGYSLSGLYGHTMVVKNASGTELHTFEADGTVTRTPVTAPDGGSVGVTVVGDLDSVVVSYAAGGTSHSGLLDFASARVVEIPDVGLATMSGLIWRLSGDTVAWAYNTDGNGVYHLYSRSGLLDGTNRESRNLPSGDQSVVRAAIVGDGLVTAEMMATSMGYFYPAVSITAADVAPVTVLPKTDWGTTALIQAPDSTALVVGGTGARDWAVRRITAQPGQTPTTTPLMPVRDPVNNAGLLYHQGLVRHTQAQTDAATDATQYAVYNHLLIDEGWVKPGGSAMRFGPVPCEPEVRCVRLAEEAQEGVAYVTPGVDGGPDSLVTFRQGPYSYSKQALPTHNGRVVDVGSRYILVNDGTSNDQYLVNNAYGTTTRLGSITGAALWYDTLWRSTGTAGQIQAVDVRTSATSRTISTGSACVPTEVQTSPRWLYWSCGGSGPTGVYDLQGNRNLRVPAGPAMLGDGFLVRHENAALQLSDFHDGTVQPAVKLVDLAAGNPADGRRVTWAVDRHGSGVAYVESDNAVHVLDTGVPATPPQLGTSSVNDIIHPRTPGHGLYGYVGLSRPVTGWHVTITRAWTGEEVHQLGGSLARESLTIQWDGNLTSGQPALNGPYRWTLAATTADGTTSTTVGSGQFFVNCGTFPFRGYACYGGPGLLGVKSTGEAHWYGTRQDGTVPGRLYDNGYTESWCLSCTGSARTSALVPFGDYNGDAYPDLLVRDGNGYMKAHLGIGQLHFGGRSIKSLGGGWMMYKSILAPGDVNRDGHDDILGIDTYGKLWLYTTTGTGGINPRVQVGSGWNIYKRVIGAGDLNGDGHGDLIGIDAYGVMYTYFSNGNKGWSSRAKVFSGWNIYNSVVAIGDLNEDGRNDLVARDAYGVLWHYAGLGNGSFAARVKAGTGWNMYKIII